MRLLLKPLATLLPWRSKEPHADKLYGAIMAQARLPVLYQRLGAPDTLEGRFVVLTLHLFAVLHRLKNGGPQAAEMAQALADLFTADMETVLREVGVGDMSIPKKVRKLIASGAGLLQSYEEAYACGGERLQETIAEALPGDEDAARAAGAQLTPYLEEVLRELETQSVQDLCVGTLRFPPI